MQLKPLNKHVLVKVVSTEKKSEGGLWFPANSQGPAEGVVSDIAQGCTSAIDIADVVIFRRNVGHEFVDGEDKYLLIAEDDLIAKVKK